MDHNDKRHSVPAGTFTDRNPAVPMESDASQTGRRPASAASTLSGSAAADHGAQDVQDAAEVREDTLPGFQMEPLIPRQRVRTLLGVPALSGVSSETDPTTAYRLSDAARGHEQKISAAIAEVLDGLHQDAPSQQNQESSELDHGFDDGFDASTLVSSRDARGQHEAEYEEDALEDSGQRLQLMELELVDPAAGSQRTPPPPPPTVAAAQAGAAAAALPDDSLAGFGEASLPAVIDIAPPPRHDLGEPIALQAVSSLEELGAEIGQRHDGATAELGGQSGRGSVLTAVGSDVTRRGGHRPVQSSGAAASQQLDGSARLGLLSVAAVMLLATGVWYVTGGTFRRASDLEAPVALASARPVEKAPAPSAPTAPKPTANTTTTAPTATAATETTRAPAIDPGQVRALVPAEHATEKPSAKPAASASTPKPAAAPRPAAASEAAASSKPAAANRHAVHTAQVQAPRPKAKPESAPAPAAQLPDQPSRSDVLNRLEAVRSSVRACAAGRSGVADLDITIANTGMVMHVLVGGDFAGTTEGSCIARAVRGARFPTFKQERFRLLFPYAI